MSIKIKATDWQWCYTYNVENSLIHVGSCKHSVCLSLFSPDSTYETMTSRWPSVWVKMSSSWICIALYVWTLAAPLILVNRDFDWIITVAQPTPSLVAFPYKVKQNVSFIKKKKCMLFIAQHWWYCLSFCLKKKSMATLISLAVLYLSLWSLWL